MLQNKKQLFISCMAFLLSFSHAQAKILSPPEVQQLLEKMDALVGSEKMMQHLSPEATQLIHEYTAKSNTKKYLAGEAIVTPAAPYVATFVAGVITGVLQTTEGGKDSKALAASDSTTDFDIYTANNYQYSEKLGLSTDMASTTTLINAYHNGEVLKTALHQKPQVAPLAAAVAHATANALAGYAGHRVGRYLANKYMGSGKVLIDLPMAEDFDIY